MEFTLKQLIYFRAVAEHGSLTAAAEAVNLSQSAMSNAISELEKSLGVNLVIRQASRGLFLTDSGKLLAVEASRLLEDAEEIVAQVRSDDYKLRGPLRIGCYRTLVSTTMPEVISQFMKANPEIDIQLLDGDESELVQWLRTGACDLILTYGFGLPTDIAFRSITTIHSYALVAKDHDLATTEIIDAVQLRRFPFILLDIPPSKGFFNEILVSLGISQTPRFRTTSSTVVRAMVANGLGFSILTQRSLGIGSDSYTDRLHAVPLAESVAAVEVGIAKLSSARLSRRAQAFCVLLESEIPRLISPTAEAA